MNITIQIQAPELVKAIESLAVALSGGKSIVPSDVSAPAEIMVEKTEPKKEQETAKPEVTETPEVKNEVEKTAVDTKAEEPEKKEPETPFISLEVVRGKLAALSQSGKQKEVKALITSFGAKKLTDIPAEKYAELLAAAEEIA